MSEEIIIDGVNIAGCDYYNAKNDKGDWCDLTCTREHAPFFRCESMPNCYYKQFQRLKQENEKLKEENYQLQKSCQICENFIDGIPCKPLRDMDYDLQKVINQRDKYINALEEIRERLKSVSYLAPQSTRNLKYAIEDIISEVLNELHS